MPTESKLGKPHGSIRPINILTIFNIPLKTPRRTTNLRDPWVPSHVLMLESQQILHLLKMMSHFPSVSHESTI